MVLLNKFASSNFSLINESRFKVIFSSYFSISKFSSEKSEKKSSSSSFVKITFAFAGTLDFLKFLLEKC